MPVSQSTKELQRRMAQEGLLPDLASAAQHELVFLAQLPPVGFVQLPFFPHVQ